MPLFEMQKLLARLYTDAQLREQFLKHPEAVCTRFGLTAVEKTQLQSLDWGAVERFARSLVNKRLKLVKPRLPGTCALLGKALAEVFLTYCERFPLEKRLKSHEEALQFILFLPSAFCRFLTKVAYAREVIAYEQTPLELMVNPMTLEPVADASETLAQLETGEWRRLHPVICHHLRVKPFDYPVDELIPRLVAGEIPKVNPVSIWMLFARRPQSHQVRARRIKPSTQHLLSLCQGHYPIEVILEKLEVTLEIEAQQRLAFEAECHQFFRQLAQEGVLAFV